jgi:REP element-mobilizing transposase RayT
VPFRVDHPDVTSRLRLRDYDYSTPGVYFVTICTEDRACLFGDVVDGVLIPHTSGLMVESWWHTIPRRYPSVDVADVVVMPNHLHGLIMLGTDPEHEVLLPLSKVVGWFKSITTADYRRGVGWPRFPGKLWQDGFYDHIVRTDAAQRRIEQYIAANPANWAGDDYHPDRDRGSAGLPARFTAGRTPRGAGELGAGGRGGRSGRARPRRGGPTG